MCLPSSLRIWLFLATLSIAIIFGAHSVFGREGTLWSFVFVLILNTVVYFWSDRHLLRTLEAVELEGRDAWGLLEMRNRLHKKAGTPPPSIFVIDLPIPTSLALGRNSYHGSIVFSRALFEVLNRDEVFAVLAHEMARVKRLETLATTVITTYGLWLMTLASWVDWAITLGLMKRRSQRFLFSWLASMLSLILIRLVVSSKSYYETDEMASSWLSDPRILAQALWKLNSYAETTSTRIQPILAHLFIVNPLPPHLRQMQLFQIQPSTDRRIRNLTGAFPI